MLIALTADVHFDTYSRLSTPHASGMTSRLVDLVECWRWMTKTAHAAGASLFIVAGDLYNNRTSIDVTVLDAVCRVVQETADVMQVIILPGNHDSHLRTPQINSVQSLRGNAIVVDEPQLIHLTGGVGIGCVPWMDDVTAFRQGVQTVAATCAEWLVTHVLLEGASPSGGIPVEYLLPNRFKKIFVGDVHDTMQITGAPNVYYIGAPMQFDWRDAGRKRGFRLYDTKTDQLQFVENTHSPKFHVVTTLEQVAHVAVADFVRVKSEDVETATALAAMVKKKKIKWVESANVTLEAEAPRMHAKASDSKPVLYAQYVRHVLPEASDEVVEQLVQEALSIAAEAVGQ